MLKVKNNMQSITPFIWFEKDASLAANFYVSIFPNSKILNASTMSDTPSGTVEIYNINLNGQDFTLMSAGPFRKINEAVSFVVTCQNQAEVDYYWEKLSAVKSAEQCGWLKDKYGVSWQIVPKQLGELMSDPNPATAGRVQQAMLKMKKIIISDLQKAHDNLS